MSSADLRDEYRRLQEQQRRKLERVKELRQAKSQPQSGDSNKAFGGITDDLGLHTAPPAALPDNSEIQDLRDRVRSLDDENARVKKLLAEKDFETNQLRKKLASQRQRPPGAGKDEDVAGGISGDAAVAKVMELSRRVRELTAEVASERNKAAQASRRVRELESRPPPASAVAEPQEKPLSRGEREELETELRRVRERLSELRTLHQTSQRELKMAKKALSEETGLAETVTVQEILSGQSNWRGRQQQILTLERQVKELKRQVSNIQQQQVMGEFIAKEAPELITNNGATTIGRELLSHVPSNTSSAVTFRSSVSHSTNSAPSRNHAALLKMQKERREKAEAELKEKKELEVETAELKKRLGSEKARCQTLSNETKALKAQVDTLLKKGKHDDELIESMTKREKGLRELLDQNEASKIRVESSQRSLVEQVNQQKAQESQILLRMREIVQDKEAIIQAKEDQILQLQDRLTSASNGEPLLPVPPLPPVVSARSQDLDEDEGKLKRPSSAKSSSRQSSRPPSSRTSARSTNATPTPSQRPFSRSGLPPSGSNLAAELEDAQVQLRAAEVERDRLRELLLLQDARYQESITARAAAEQALAGLRRRSASLERQAGGGSSVVTGVDLSDVERLIRNEDLPVTRSTVKELQEALAMSQEEVETRKQALKSTLEAKQQDVKWLMEIMEKTRQVYLCGIQKVKQQHKA